MRIFVVAALVACSSSKQPPPAAKGSAQPPPLPAGPVPVTLPALEAAQLRTLTSASNGFLTIDAQGVVRWGLEAKAPFAGELLQRDDSPFAQLFPYPEDRGHEHHAFRAEAAADPEPDAVAVRAVGPATEVLVLADAAAPARITLHQLPTFSRHAVTLAAGAANTAIKYRFGGSSDLPRPDLVLDIRRLDLLEGAPEHVQLEITDATTTGELVHALGVLSAAGVPNVIVHRMMGWGVFAPVAAGSNTTMSHDFTSTMLEEMAVADPTVDGGLSSTGVTSAIDAAKPRFRYCYEVRDLLPLRGTVKLGFDVAADGAISHAKATGVDKKVADCIEKSVFDLDISPLAITGPGHVTVAITFTPNEKMLEDDKPAPPPQHDGYWCFTDTGAVSLCAPLEDECNVALDAYTRSSAQFGETTNPTPCAHQASAWTSDGRVFHPTRAACGKGCRQVH